MHLKPQRFTSLLMAAVVAAPMFIAGCAVHARYYDPYRRDYHGWNGEVVYYGQWEHDTHRDHREFRARNKDEQSEYWHWRHDHDRDHH